METVDGLDLEQHVGAPDGQRHLAERSGRRRAIQRLNATATARVDSSWWSARFRAGLP